MEISTFDEDLLGLQGFADKLESFIQVEHSYVGGSLVIGLNSNFGSGKSTFLKMWRNKLSQGQNDSEGSLVIIPINAWESDYFGDPLFALISALATSLDGDGQHAQALKDAAKDFGWFVAAIGNQVATKVSGIDAIAAGEVAKKKKEERENNVVISPDAFSAFEAREKAMTSLKEIISKIFEGETPRALILVDELDRCRPDYAVTYLETIKHIFDIKGLVFVLAVDRKQLECSAKTAFGAELDFKEYYRKFVHREVSLPIVSSEGYANLANAYVDFYLQKEGIRNCFMAIERDRLEEIKELIGSLRLTPRQIQEAFRIMGHIFHTSENNKGRLYWALATGSILMAVLKVGEPEVYVELGTQNFGVHDAAKFFGKLFEAESLVWWFVLCLTGSGLKKADIDGKQVEVILKQVGLLPEDREYDNGSLRYYSAGWGRSSDRFRQIFSKIEEVSTWE